MQLSTNEILATMLTKKMLQDAATPMPVFLQWVADRLVHVHGDSEMLDFIHALRDRATQLEEISKHLGVYRAAD